MGCGTGSAARPRAAAAPRRPMSRDGNEISPIGADGVPCSLFFILVQLRLRQKERGLLKTRRRFQETAGAAAAAHPMRAHRRRGKRKIRGANCRTARKAEERLFARKEKRWLETALRRKGRGRVIGPRPAQGNGTGRATGRGRRGRPVSGRRGLTGGRSRRVYRNSGRHRRL